MFLLPDEPRHEVELPTLFPHSPPATRTSALRGETVSSQPDGAGHPSLIAILYDFGSIAFAGKTVSGFTVLGRGERYAGVSSHTVSFLCNCPSPEEGMCRPTETDDRQLQPGHQIRALVRASFA
jgi:hypothetical protein